MVESDNRLTPGARDLVTRALERQRDGKQATLALNHWLLALLERHRPMAESLVDGLVAADYEKQVLKRWQQGEAGAALDAERLVEQALRSAQTRGKAQATERDLAAVILAGAGFPLKVETSFVVSGTAKAEASVASPPLPVGVFPRDSRPTRPTPTLEQFGRDLTRQAAEGRLPTIVGRESEIEQAIETLCRQTKRNLVLLGPAGVGKTAIVEGLARRIHDGAVPSMLAGARLFAIQPSTLVAGAGIVGELEKRMKAILAEASQDGILLFIDELHAIVGAGGRAGSSDIASLLKPALARGDLACLAATTDDEYRRFIEPDGALERRFHPIRVAEPGAEHMLAIMRSAGEDFGRRRSVTIGDDVIAWLLDFATCFIRTRHFPDKGVDLLDQAVARAVSQGRSAVTIDDARKVAERTIGSVSVARPSRESLVAALADTGMMATADVDALARRLSVTSLGLDVRPDRPNAIVLLSGATFPHRRAIAEKLADALFGSADRIVSVDFSRMGDRHDLSMLIGAPPGYVGYTDALPLHQLAQSPWSVLLAENVHACHPAIREVLRQGLHDGFIADAVGKKIFLSDALVILTARMDRDEEQPQVGFLAGGGGREHDDVASLTRLLGEGLISEVDLVCMRASDVSHDPRKVELDLLESLRHRFQKQGLDITWDESIPAWLSQKRKGAGDRGACERVIDEFVAPHLVKWVTAPAQTPRRRLLITHAGGSVNVNSLD